MKPSSPHHNECRKCGFQIKDEMKFCPECGETLIRKCPSCDVSIREHAKYCPECGVSSVEETRKTITHNEQIQAKEECRREEAGLTDRKRKEELSGIMGLLCFLFFPIGFIIWASQKNRFPGKAKSALVISCVSLGIGLLAQISMRVAAPNRTERSTSSTETVVSSTQETGSERNIINYNGFQWLVGPDRDSKWNDALDWISGLGSGWRLPTMDELSRLYESGIHSRNWGDFQNSGIWVWSSQSHDSYSSMGFDFSFGGNRVETHEYSRMGRVFAVRP